MKQTGSIFSPLILLCTIASTSAYAQCEPEMQLILQGQPAVEIKEDTPSLASGSLLRIEVKQTAGCNWVLFWKDSQGQVFNVSGHSFSPVEGVKAEKNKIYSVPGENKWFKLDFAKGIETLVLVSKTTVFTGLNQIGMKIARLGNQGWSDFLSKEGYDFVVREINHI